MPKKSQREGCHCCKAFSPSKFTQKGWQYLDRTGKCLLFLLFLPLQELFLQIEHFFLPALQENFWQTPLEAAKVHPMSVGKMQINSFKLNGTIPIGVPVQSIWSLPSSSSSALAPKLLLWSCQRYWGGKISTGLPHCSWNLWYDQQQVTEHLKWETRRKGSVISLAPQRPGTPSKRQTSQKELRQALDDKGHFVLSFLGSVLHFIKTHSKAPFPCLKACLHSLSEAGSMALWSRSHRQRKWGKAKHKINTFLHNKRAAQKLWFPLQVTGWFSVTCELGKTLSANISS